MTTTIRFILLFVLILSILSACAVPTASESGIPGVTVEFRQLIDRNGIIRAYRFDDPERNVTCYIPAPLNGSGTLAISCVSK